MPIGVAEAGELVSTTLRSRTGKLADNVSRNNEIYRRLMKRGNVKPWRGGRTILQEVSYSGNTSWKRYRGYELLNVTPNEVIGSFEFDPKYAAISVSISGDELLMNYGDSDVIDLLEGRIENAMAEAANNLSSDMYSDGTADSGKQIGGLQLLVASNPLVGTVGGINRATWAFARNQRYRAVTDGGAAATSANITGYMDALWLSLKRGADIPDLILADNNYFRLFEQSTQGLQRIVSVAGDNVAGVGFDGYKFKGADVVPDGGQGGFMPANTMYFLNTKYIFMRPHEDRNMTEFGGDRVPTNQDAMVKFIGFAGNMTGSNFALQGQLNGT